MKHLIKNSLHFVVVAATLSSTSCARFSKADKARFTALDVPGVVILPDAYARPTFTSNGTAGAAGLVGGVAGGLIGGLVVAAVVGTKEAVSAGRHKDELALVEQHTPKDIAAIVTQQVHNDFSQRPLLGSLLANGTARPWHLRVEVTNYGLQKVADGKHSPSIFAKFWLEDPAGKKFLRSAAFSSAPESNASASLQLYANDPALLRQHFEICSKGLAGKVAKLIEEKLR